MQTIQINSFDHFKKVVEEQKFIYKFVILVTVAVNVVFIATYVVGSIYRNSDFEDGMFPNNKGLEILAGFSLYLFILLTYFLHISMIVMFYRLIMHFTEIF